MRRLFRFVVYALCFCLLAFVGAYFVLLSILQKNGITFAEKDFDLPSSLKIKNLQIIQPGLTASFGDVEINLSLANAIRGRIYGDYLIVNDGEIANSTVQTNDTSETNYFKDMIPVSFKKIEISNIVFKNIDNGDTLFLSIPELQIANIHLGDKWHIDSLINKKSRLEWLSHSTNVKQEQKTDSTQTKSFLNDIPEFSIDNLNFIDCDFFFQTPSQKHSIKKFNLELIPQKENEQFTMAVNKFSLIYQDTLDVNLSLNKVLVNNKEEMQMSDLAFDFPWLKLRIPQLNISNAGSPMIDVQFRDSYVNTALVKLFVPATTLPLAHDLGIEFKGNMSYSEDRLGFRQVEFMLSKSTSVLLDGYADIPGKPGTGLQLKIVKLQTSTTDLAQLFELKSLTHQKRIDITSAITLSGSYENLKAEGSVSLNKMVSDFNAIIDQRNKKIMAVALNLSSRALDVNQVMDSLGTELKFTDFRISAQTTFNANNELSDLSAFVTCDSMFISSQRLGYPTIKFRLSPSEASASINLPDLFTLTLNSPDNIKGDMVRYNGFIESTLPQLSNTDSAAGDFYSSFSGLYTKAATAMEFKLVLDKISFEPVSYDKEYLTSGILTAGQSSNGDLHLNLSLDGDEVVRFQTSADIYDWWGRKNKWNGNFPEIELDLALSVDSLLINQFTGQTGLLQLDKLQIRAGGDDITANIELPAFFINTYNVRDLNGSFELSPDELNGAVTAALFQNPYATLQDVKINTAQRDEQTFGISIKTLLPEVQNDMELNTLVSFYDSTYLINLDENFLRFGNNSWQNLNSQGFIFDRNFDFVSGDMTVVNGRQKINIETSSGVLSLKIDSLNLDSLAHVLSNDTVYHGNLNITAQYDLLDDAITLSGTISDVEVNNRELGTLKFEGFNNNENLNAHISVNENYGKADFSIRKEGTPLIYNLDISDLDLTYVNSGMPWQNTIPVTGQINAKLNGSYDKELKSVGYVSFKNVETYLTENRIYLKADQDTLWFRDTEVLARNFKLYDKKGNTILLDGKLTLASEPLIDMTVQSKEFRILDASNNTKDLKGAVAVSTDLRIKRSPDQFEISGSLAVLPNSSINYLYETTVTLDEREKEVTFVSFKELDLGNSDTLANFRFTNRTKPIEWDVKLNVGKSDITIVLDESSQDKIKMTADGNFLLKTGSNDEPFFYGTLKSNEGSIAYDAPMVSDIDLKIENVLVKWNGELSKPRMTFLGSETFRVQPKGIPGMSNNTSVVPIDVLVKVDDRPIEDFDLSFDLNSTNAKVKSWIQSLPEDTREANAINLLLFGTLNFGETAENPSYVQTLAAKMNEISRRNIKNADLSFYSSSQDVSESKSETTDKLGYSFSKGLFNKNVKISIGGTLDFNSSPEPNQKKSSALSNIQLDYIISESPDITLNAAQQATYDGVINGQINETSMGITYLKRFRNFFKSPTNPFP